MSAAAVELTHDAIPGLANMVEPIDSVTPRESNPNEGDVGAMVQQLEARGQHRLLVYQEGTRQIIAGEHLWRGAKALGWTGLAMVGVEEDDLDAEARMVGDNLPGRRSRDDDRKLAEVLARLHQAGKLEGAGYEPEDLGDTLRRLEMPSLEALTATHGEPDERDFYPTVKVRVPPLLYETWSNLCMQRGATEVEVFTDLVTAAVGEVVAAEAEAE